MIVLGFDTATPATAVGLRLADGTTLRARDDPAAGDRSPETHAFGAGRCGDAGRNGDARQRRASPGFGGASVPRIGPRFGQPGHTTRLLPLAAGLLAQVGVGWADLERIAVGVGPGTFTGLRVGVATARGLAQSLGVEVVGVGSLRVLAEAALREAPPRETALREPDARPARSVLATIDARRGEAFAAAYDATGELSPPRAVPPEGLAAIPALAETGIRAAGLCLPASVGGDREWLAVGEGALRFRGHLEAIAIAVAADASPLHCVDAGVLCELAVSAPAGDLEAVLPDYRRRPDAEVALEERAGSEQRAVGGR